MATTVRIWEHTRLTCAIVKQPLGHLCGYVSIPREHPLFGCDYDDTACASLEVHGGLTYAESPNWDDGDKSLWAFGFDCAHLGDIVPGLTVPGQGTYKNVNYVTRETERLADQLAAYVRVLQVKKKEEK